MWKNLRLLQVLRQQLFGLGPHVHRPGELDQQAIVFKMGLLLIFLLSRLTFRPAVRIAPFC